MAGVLGRGSPGVGQKFPGDPRRSTARFRLAIGPDCSVADIYIRLGEEVLRLGRITVHGGDTRTFMDPHVGFDGAPFG